MIGICLPSRGLIFSRTMQSVIKGMQELSKHGIASDYFPCHDLPIPSSHNFCVEQALQNSLINKIFLIEEDMYIPSDDFLALATSDYDIIMLQYNDKNGSPHGIIHYDHNGEVLWGGLGAVCIKKEVFESIGKPYFRTDHRYRIIKKKTEFDGKLVVEYEEMTPRQVWNEKENKFDEVNDEYKYGGLDIDFYTRARKKGYKIVVLHGKAQHFELVALGQRYTNDGVHEIRTV